MKLAVYISSRSRCNLAHTSENAKPASAIINAFIIASTRGGLLLWFIETIRFWFIGIWAVQK